MTFYKCLKAFLRFLFLPLFRVKIIGAENFAQEGGCILYANHYSNWDPLFMHLAINRKPRFMAKSELFKNAFLRAIVTFFGAFPVERGKGDFAALKNAFSAVENGDVVGIYPEGTRSKNGQINGFHSGVSIIAIRTGAKAYPMYISGRFRLFKRTYMVFGEPVDIKEKFGNIKLSDHDEMRRATEYLREELIKLKSEAKA